MKNIWRYVLVITLTCNYALLMSQSLGINYQGIARDTNGDPLSSRELSLRLTLSVDASDGTIVYRETQVATTNPFGLFSIVVGRGTPQIGVFNSIDWTNPVVWMTVEMDPLGGGNFQFVGSQQLQAVPFAKFAESARLQAGAGIAVSGTTVTNTLPDKTVTVTGFGTVTSSGTYPNFQITGNPQDLQLISDELKITSNPNATPIDLSGYKQTLQGVLTEGNDAGLSTITNLGAPATDSDAANKLYVDNGDADYAFKANIDFPMTGSGNESIELKVPEIDQGPAIQSNQFVAPVAGVYMFFVDAKTGNTLATQIKFVKNSGTSPEPYPISSSLNANTSFHSHTGMIMLLLNAGDTIEVQVISSSAGNISGTFFGYKL